MREIAIYKIYHPISFALTPIYSFFESNLNLLHLSITENHLSNLIKNLSTILKLKTTIIRNPSYASTSIG